MRSFAYCLYITRIALPKQYTVDITILILKNKSQQGAYSLKFLFGRAPSARGEKIRVKTEILSRNIGFLLA